MRTIRNIIITYVMYTVAPVFDISVRFTTIRRDASMSWDPSRVRISPAAAVSQVWPSSYYNYTYYCLVVQFIFLYCYNRNRVAQQLPKNNNIVIMMMIIIFFFNYIYCSMTQYRNYTVLQCASVVCANSLINEEDWVKKKTVSRPGPNDLISSPRCA